MHQKMKDSLIPTKISTNILPARTKKRTSLQDILAIVSQIAINQEKGVWVYPPPHQNTMKIETKEEI